MNEKLNIVTIIDHENKKIYVEEKTFAYGSVEGMQALRDSSLIIAGAEKLGYQILKQEKKVTHKM